MLRDSEIKLRFLKFLEMSNIKGRLTVHFKKKLQSLPFMDKKNVVDYKLDIRDKLIFLVSS